MLDLEGLRGMIQREGQAMGWHGSAMLRPATRGKNSSHSRTSFSQMRARNGRGVGVQRPSEFKTEQVVVIEVCDPDGLGLHNPGRGP